MMKITITAVGSRGDVQPLVALGKGLSAAGHCVTIASHAMFERVVQEAELRFYQLRGPSPKEVVDRLIQQDGTHGNKIKELRNLWSLTKLLKPGVFEGGDSCWEACQGAETVIYSTLGYPLASQIAKALGIREIFVGLQPFDSTAEFPFLMMPFRSLGALLNRWSYRLGYLMPWLPVASAINAWRKERLKLRPLPWNYPLRWIQEPLLRLYGFSRHVIPKPIDWDEARAVTGYWFLDQPEWQPPTPLLDFLDSGPPPVCVGFGSMTAVRPEQTLDIVLQALERTKQRGLLLSGWGGLRQTRVPPHVFQIESAPHDWLFPRMAAVVHHGGAGTTAAGLRAGVPTITVPFFLDQPFWGRRVAQLGVGPAPIPRKQLSVERLAAAIQTVITDTSMHRKAEELGEYIRAEDGVKTAVEMIEHWIMRHMP